MGPEQYQQLLASRRRVGPRRLDESRPLRDVRDAPRPTALGRVVAKAVRAVRRRTLASEAWDRLAPRVLVRVLHVVSVRADVIELEATSPSVRFEFEQQRVKFERRLCQAVPGARRVVVLIAGEAARGAGQAEESA